MIFTCISIKSQYIFDDFKYTSFEVPKGIDSARNSLYGFNYWKTKTDSLPLKAWYRWNIGEPEFGKNSEIKFSKDGIILKMNKGFTELSKSPLIHSSFVTKHGKFLSRIKFGPFNETDLLTQAYWLFSPVSYNFDYNGQRIKYTSEIDFEFNNWWTGKFKPNMATGSNMHFYLFNNSNYLKINFFDNGFKFDDVEFWYLYRNQDVFYNQWFIAVFEVDTINNVSKFWLESDYDDFGNCRAFVGNSIDKVDEFKPLEIKNYQPDYQMMTVFSQHPSTKITQDTQFEIDWFFYADNSNLSVDSIKKLIQNFRNQQISKVNSANLDFYIHNENDKTVYSFIEGKDTAYSSIENTWKINHSNMKFTSYNTKFKYRLHNKHFGWQNFVNIYANKFSLKPICDYDSLELVLDLKDEWREIYKNEHKIIPIICDSTNDFEDNIISDFAYHLFTNTLMFDYKISEKSIILIDLFDINGLKIENLLEKSLEKGFYNFEKKMTELANGLYVLRIQINSKTYIKKFLSFRN